MRLRRGLVLLVLVGLLGAGPVVWAALRSARQRSESMSLVRRAATAHKRVSYSGKLSWRLGKWERLVHVAHDSKTGRTFYGWSLLWNYVAAQPSSKAPDPVAWCRSLSAVERNYRAEVTGRSSYLDRAVRVVRLTPRYEGRPTLELTVDAETDLPLKVATFRLDGSLVKVVAFRKIRIGPQEIAPRRPRHGRSRSIPREQAIDKVTFQHLEPAYLPKGFEFHECRISGVSVRKLTFVYTDGISKLELEQGIIPTPAQMETEYALRYGKRRAKRRMRWYWEAAKRAIVQSDSKRGATVTAKRRHKGRCKTYELTVGKLDVELSAPAHLPAEESARVLRSLHVR